MYNFPYGRLVVIKSSGIFKDVFIKQVSDGLQR